MPKASDSVSTPVLGHKKYQLDDLILSVAGCQELLRNTVKSSRCPDEDIGSDSWLTEPRSALARAQSIARVTDLQLEALFAIESFCLLCDRIRGGGRSGEPCLNASNATSFRKRLLSTYRSCSTSSAVATRESGCQVPKRGGEQHFYREEDTLQDACSSFGKSSNNRATEGSRRLGTFKSAIIRQLWEIHRLLKALVDKQSPVLTKTLPHNRDKKRLQSKGGVRLAQEHQYHRGEGDDAQLATQNTAIQVESRQVECHNCQTALPAMQKPRKPRRELLKLQPHPPKRLPLDQGRPTAITSQSVSEWNFACAQTANRQLCFASTVCVGPPPPTGTAKQVKTDCKNVTEPTSPPVWGDYITFLSQTISHCEETETCTSNDRMITIDTEVSSSDSSSMEPSGRQCDSIVFQRRLSKATSVRKKIATQREPLVATLSRLKLRIDAIKWNLAMSYGPGEYTQMFHRHRRNGSKKSAQHLRRQSGEERQLHLARDAAHQGED